MYLGRFCCKDSTEIAAKYLQRKKYIIHISYMIIICLLVIKLELEQS